MKKSGDNESCVGKQKSNKSTRDQNGAGERDKKRSIQEASIAHALCTCFLLRQRCFAMGFFSLRAHYIPGGRSSAGLFCPRSAAKSTPHKYGPISSVFRANTPARETAFHRVRGNSRPLKDGEGAEVARRLFQILMVLKVQKKIITGPRLDPRSEDNRKI